MAIVFDYNCYKSFLKADIKENAAHRGYQTQLSKAAACQPSYLSQVLATKAQLTPDHAAGIAAFLSLQGLEQDYFLALVTEARAVSSVLRELTQKKLHEIKLAHRKLSERILTVTRSENAPNESLYASSWLWMAVHFSTSIPKFQQVKTIAAYLNVRPDKVQSILDQLLLWGQVRHESGRWSFATSSFHLHRDSPATEAHHLNWRARAVLDIQNPKKDSIHYSAVFTMSEEDYKKLSELVIKSIEKGRKIIEPSEPKKMYCLNQDLFEL